MLAYFPSLYPDELLYSAIARYGVHTGLSSPAVHRELFGREVQHPSLAFPPDLDELGRRTGLNSDRLIFDHTNLPYFTAFMDDGRAGSLVAAMKARPGTLKAVHVAVLGPGAPLQPMNALRFCPECAQEAIEAHGEAFWRRVHQLPIVVVCPDHGCDLRTTAPLMGNARRQLHAATNHEMSTAETSVVREGIEDRDRSSLVALAKECQAMLAGNNPTGLDRDFPTIGFRAALIGKGFNHKSFGVEWREVRAQVADSWMARTWPALFPELAKGGHWLSRIVTSPGDQTRADLIHLAFHVVGSLPSYDVAFGDGPWPCMNPLASHFGEDVVTAVARQSHRGVTTGHFTCGCGFVYTRQRNADGSLTKPRHSRFGPLLAPYVEGAADRGWTFARVTAELGVYPRTLQRALKVEGITVKLKKRRPPTKRSIAE